MGAPVVIDECGELNSRLGRFSWRDDEAEPWRSVSEFGLKPVGELRAILSAAIVSGKVKYKFYRIDSGKPASGPAISASTDLMEGTTMNKEAKSKKETRNKIVADALQAAKAGAKAAPEKKERKQGPTGFIFAELQKAHPDGITKDKLVAKVTAKFPDRPTCGNTVPAFLQHVKKAGLLIVRETEKTKFYAVKPDAVWGGQRAKKAGKGKKAAADKAVTEAPKPAAEVKEEATAALRVRKARKN